MNATQDLAIPSVHHLHYEVLAGRSNEGPGEHTSDATRGSNIGKLDTAMQQLDKLVGRLAEASHDFTTEGIVVHRNLALSMMTHSEEQQGPPVQSVEKSGAGSLSSPGAAETPAPSGAS